MEIELCIPIFVIMMRKDLRTNFLKNCVIIEKSGGNFQDPVRGCSSKIRKSNFC